MSFKKIRSHIYYTPSMCALLFLLLVVGAQFLVDTLPQSNQSLSSASSHLAYIFNSIVDMAQR